MFGFCLQFLNFQISKPKSYQLCEDAPSPMLLAKCFLPQEAFFSLSFSESATFSLPQPSSHCLLYLRLGTQTTGWVLFCLVLRWGGGIITFQIGVKRNMAADVWAFTILLTSYQKSLCVSYTHTHTQNTQLSFGLNMFGKNCSCLSGRKEKYKFQNVADLGLNRPSLTLPGLGTMGSKKGLKSSSSGSAKLWDPGTQGPWTGLHLLGKECLFLSGPEVLPFLQTIPLERALS